MTMAAAKAKWVCGAWGFHMLALLLSVSFRVESRAKWPQPCGAPLTDAAQWCPRGQASAVRPRGRAAARREACSLWLLLFIRLASPAWEFVALGFFPGAVVAAHGPRGRARRRAAGAGGRRRARGAVGRRARERSDATEPRGAPVSRWDAERRRSRDSTAGRAPPRSGRILAEERSDEHLV
jgi:hypothetical protein